MKIAVFDSAGSYFNAPTLRCILEEMDAVGAEVDLYVRYGGESLKRISRASTQRFPVPFRLWRGDWMATLRGWKWFLQYRGDIGYRTLNEHSYDLTIGVDPEGVIAAHQHWKKTATPFIYLSFELIFRDELHGKGNLLFKAEEVAASRDAAMIIIQDNWRAKLLIDENQVPTENVEMLPVAPRGSAPRHATDYVRKLFGIQNDKIVVLQAGSFRDFTCANEILASLSQWPESMVLIVNTPYALDPKDQFISRVRKVSGGRAYVTAGAYAPTELDVLIRSSDIGLAFYQRAKGAGRSGFLGRNIEIMGLSSGKVATFASNGIPIVCGGNPTLKHYLERYRFGEYADTFRDLPTCLMKVSKNKEAYGLEARRFFDEQLDFDRFWPTVWNRMRNLVR
jgi:hypothetical protein